MPTVNLTWTQAETIGPRIESYKVYRQAGNGAFVLLSTLPLVFGSAPLYAWTDPTPAYSDTTAADDTSYTYRVDAYTDDGRAISSNEFAIVTPAVLDHSCALVPAASDLSGAGYHHVTGTHAAVGTVDAAGVKAIFGALTLDPFRESTFPDEGLTLAELSASTVGGDVVLTFAYGRVSSDIGDAPAVLPQLQLVIRHCDEGDSTSSFSLDSLPAVVDPSGVASVLATLPPIAARTYQWLLAGQGGDTDSVLTPGARYDLTVLFS